PDRPPRQRVVPQRKSLIITITHADGGSIQLPRRAYLNPSQFFPKVPSRMLKEFVQPGRSERRPEAYPCGTLRGRSDARTPLADFFSILLVKYHGFSAIHQHPPFD